METNSTCIEKKIREIAWWCDLTWNSKYLLERKIVFRYTELSKEEKICQIAWWCDLTENSSSLDELSKKIVKLHDVIWRKILYRQTKLWKKFCQIAWCFDDIVWRKKSSSLFWALWVCFEHADCRLMSNWYIHETPWSNFSRHAFVLRNIGILVK